MRRAWPLLALPLVVVACTGKDPYNPGTPLGTYRVEARLTEDSCAQAPPTWTFDIKLAKDPGILYWIQGGAPVAGHADRSGRYAMTSHDTRRIHEADVRRGIPLCAITRDDAVELALAAGDRTFEGTLAYRYGVAEGADCSDQLTQAGGTFAALPCTVRFTLAGTATTGR